MKDTNNNSIKSPRAEWEVTRRQFLKASGLVAAGLSTGISPLRAATGEGPSKICFGIVTDAHYADKPGGRRVYRESLAKMTE